MYKLIFLGLVSSRSIREVLQSDEHFSQDMFKELLTRPDIPHIFLSEANKLISGLQSEFKEVVKVHSIGSTWENRPMQMITLDMDPEASSKMA